MQTYLETLPSSLSPSLDTYLRLGLGAVLFILGRGGRVVLITFIVPSGIRAVVSPGAHADPAELELALAAGHVVAALREGGR